jgi:hypothetical protein
VTTINPSGDGTAQILSGGDNNAYFFAGSGGSFGYLMITPSGNVGIATTNPAFKLDVTGDIHASGWLRTDSGVVFPDGTTQTTAAAGHQFGGMYTIDNSCNGQICQGGNPFTGGCSCPAGFSASGALLTGQTTCQNYYAVFCYK